MPDIRLDTLFNARLMPKAGPGFYDNFERANSPTLGVSSGERRAYRVHGESGARFTVEDGKATARTAGASEAVAAYETLDAETTIGTLTARLFAQGNRMGGICYGMSGETIPQNFYRIGLRNSPTDLVYRIDRYENGSQAATTRTEIAPADGDLIQVVLTETTHEVRINGVAISGPSARRANTLNNRHGLYLVTGADGIQFDAIQFDPAA